MDENLNNQPQQPQEPGQPANMEQPGQGADPAAEQNQTLLNGVPLVQEGGTAALGDNGKKPGSWLPFAIIGGILAIAIVVILFASGIFSPSPEQILKTATQNTTVQYTGLFEKIYQELPAMQPYVGETAPTKTSFKLSLDKLEGSVFESIGLPVQLVSLLQTFSIDGYVVDDTKDGRLEIEGALRLQDNDLLSGYAYISSDEIGFGMPSIAPEMLGFNLDTMEEDYRNSPFYMGDADELQQAIAESKESIQQIMALMSSSDSIMNLGKEMQQEMKALTETVFQDAEYKLVSNSGGIQTIEVQLKGENVKQFTLDVAHYIYIDSPLGQVYESIFTQEAMGISWKQLIELMLAQFKSVLPDMPTTLTYEIKDELIQSTHIQIHLGTNESAQVVSVDIAYNPTGYSMSISGILTFDMQTMDLNITEDVAYANGEYTVTSDFMVKANQELLIGGNIDMLADQSGRLKMDMTMNSSAFGGSMNFGIDGLVSKQDNKTVWDFSRLYGSYGDGIDSAGLSFKLHVEDEPLGSTPYQPARKILNVFQLSEEEMMDISSKYEMAFENMAYLLPMMLGVAE